MVKLWLHLDIKITRNPRNCELHIFPWWVGVWTSLALCFHAGVKEHYRLLLIDTSRSGSKSFPDSLPLGRKDTWGLFESWISSGPAVLNQDWIIFKNQRKQLKEDAPRPSSSQNLPFQSYDCWVTPFLRFRSTQIDFFSFGSWEPVQVWRTNTC